MKFKIMRCHWSPTRSAKFYTILPESIRALAAESSQEMQFLVFVIVRFVILQDGMVPSFPTLYLFGDLSLCTVEFKINKVFDFKISHAEVVSC